MAPPWHKLGYAVTSDLPKERLLREAHADYDVILSPVQVEDVTNGKFVTVEDRFVTGRVDPDTLDLVNWEVVKGRYQVIPNDVILDKAIAIVSSSGNEATLDSVGVLDGGRKFFATIRTTQLNLHPKETDVPDVVDNYIVVMTSHDGSIPICYYNLDIRRSSSCVYRIAPDSALSDFSLRKRHTPHATDRLEEATQVLNMRNQWTKELTTAIEDLSVPLKDYQIHYVLDNKWSFDKANTKKKREYAESVHEMVKDLYMSDRNAGTFGETKWALYNAICEFYDFHRNIDELEGIQQSFELDNFVHREKISVFKSLLSKPVSLTA